MNNSRFYTPHTHFDQFIPFSASSTPGNLEVLRKFHGLQNLIYVSLSFPGNPGCLQTFAIHHMIMHVPAKVLQPAISFFQQLFMQSD